MVDPNDSGKIPKTAEVVKWAMEAIDERLVKKINKALVKGAASREADVQFAFIARPGEDKLFVAKRHSGFSDSWYERNFTVRVKGWSCKFKSEKKLKKMTIEEVLDYRTYC